MNKFRCYLIACIVGLFSMVQYSCDDALNLYPLDEASNETYWASVTEFKLAANEFYGYLRTFDRPNGDGHLGTDLMIDKSQWVRGTNSVPLTDNNYTDAYLYLYRINNFLANVNDYDNQKEIAQYIGEAYFFRAYVYFEYLFQNYGGVIIATTPLAPESPELLAARNTREETIDFIIEDLEKAIPLLSLESEIPGDEKGRVSKQAAMAFLGRACLYEGTWQKFRDGDATRYNMLLDKSIAYNDSVISTNEFELWDPDELADTTKLRYLFILENQKSNPAGLTKADNKEYILAVRYEQENLLNPIGIQLSHRTFSDATRKLADMFLCSDGLPIEKTATPYSRMTDRSEFENRDNRMKNFMAVPGNYYWQNLSNFRVSWLGDSADLANAIGPKNTWSNGATGYETTYWCAEREVPNSQEAWDYPVIRLAEVYLNYAEAVYERNNAISDADLDKSLNLVRMRVNESIGMPKLSNTFVTDNGLDMREEIRRERAIEFQADGIRMDDLKRWYVAHIELTKAVQGVLWSGTTWETDPTYEKVKVKLDGDGFVLVDDANNRQFSEKNYLLPLPSREVSMNENLKQNPGWEE